MKLRGVRGATTCQEDRREAIFEAVQELWRQLETDNSFTEDDIGAIIFSSTPDLSSAFPAAAVRALGWENAPLFGTVEIDNPDAVKKCVRVLVLWNTDRGQREIKHAYLRGAAVLRPDRANIK